MNLYYHPLPPSFLQIYYHNTLVKHNPSLSDSLQHDHSMLIFLSQSILAWLSVMSSLHVTMVFSIIMKESIIQVLIRYQGPEWDFSDANMYTNHLGISSGCGLSPRLCIPNQLLGDAAATALGTTPGPIVKFTFSVI